MRYADDFAGPDRLLFGSDHPRVSIATLADLAEGRDIPAEDQAKRFGLHARALFRIG